MSKMVLKGNIQVRVSVLITVVKIQRKEVIIKADLLNEERKVIYTFGEYILPSEGSTLRISDLVAEIILQDG